MSLPLEERCVCSLGDPIRVLRDQRSFQMKRRDFVKFAVAGGSALVINPGTVFALKSGGSGRFSYTSGARRIEASFTGDPLSGSTTFRWKSGKEAGTLTLRNDPKKFEKVAAAFAETGSLSLASQQRKGRAVIRAGDPSRASLSIDGEPGGQVTTQILGIDDAALVAIVAIVAIAVIAVVAMGGEVEVSAGTDGVTVSASGDRSNGEGDGSNGGNP
ncbi:MAG: hypothetical protein ACPHN2_14690 [Sinimarinibacterium flocculans]|uniref:hypothetical protein n=1 Tax=Sinimarinibacterium flocculans TaxID=985250 RepID=UPI003C5DAE2C